MSKIPPISFNIQKIVSYILSTRPLVLMNKSVVFKPKIWRKCWRMRRSDESLSILRKYFQYVIHNGVVLFCDFFLAPFKKGNCRKHFEWKCLRLLFVNVRYIFFFKNVCSCASQTNRFTNSRNAGPEATHNIKRYKACIHCNINAETMLDRSANILMLRSCSFNVFASTIAAKRCGSFFACLPS